MFELFSNVQEHLNMPRIVASWMFIDQDNIMITVVNKWLKSKGSHKQEHIGYCAQNITKLSADVAVSSEALPLRQVVLWNAPW